ncbi:methyl-accepting chemotaxis protein [Anaeroselena agilis]|uniref:Methyl-accepting chemotaxis protein n=1 Tax=Anaeroselena agilis TaxID=3063788 RepID=A0ABU3NV51_9FIRM|nr:methyl-accepting chemotaxis protein [Selenomonadales bacterium 4137-cl]
MNWFQNFKIANKLIISFLVVAVIAGAVGAVGVYNLFILAREDKVLFEYYSVPLEQMGVIKEAYQKSRVNVRDAILNKDAKIIAANIKQFDDRIKDMKSETASVGKTLVSDEGRKVHKTLEVAVTEYDIYCKELFTMIQAGQIDQVNQLMQTKGMRMAEILEGSLAKLGDMKVDLAKQKAASNKETADKATMIMLAFVAIGVLLAMVLGVFVSRLISRPLKEMVGVAGKLADGDLDVSITVRSRDEVGELAKAFQTMTDNINHAMSNINASADQVASGSKQMSDSSMALSQGATEQASSIEELTASLEEIAAQTEQNAANANQANTLAEAAKDNAAEGNSQMLGMLKAMDDINESSASISKIIKVIDEIAFQTNILALNAAVEAARAGQHGKGFAVVAEEVRNLAARSANAAKETTALIEGSIKKVEGGTRIANATATALDQIVDGVTKVAELVGQIAVASNEQAAGIAQVNQGVMQVSQVVQTNSATAEESAAASEELAGQAEILKEAVARFKLKKIGSGPNRLSELSPEIMRALENMAEKKGNSSVAKPAKIVLSDAEFGKY